MKTITLFKIVLDPVDGWSGHTGGFRFLIALILDLFLALVLINGTAKICN